MSLSRKLYEQALLIFKSFEATWSVLDLILSLFTARVIAFEPLIAQVLSFSCSWPSIISNFAKSKKTSVRALLQAQTSVLEP